MNIVYLSTSIHGKLMSSVTTNTIIDSIVNIIVEIFTNVFVLSSCFNKNNTNVLAIAHKVANKLINAQCVFSTITSGVLSSLIVVSFTLLSGNTPTISSFITSSSLSFKPNGSSGSK